MENLEFGKKKLNLYPGVLPYKKYGSAHHTFRDGQLENDGEWVGLISASLQEFYFTITASTGFFSGSSRLLYFFFWEGGGGRGWGITGGGRILLLQS